MASPSHTSTTDSKLEDKVKSILNIFFSLVFTCHPDFYVYFTTLLFNH